MDKNAIKKYAVWARRELIERVFQKALQYGITADAKTATWEAQVRPGAPALWYRRSAPSSGRKRYLPYWRSSVRFRCYRPPYGSPKKEDDLYALKDKMQNVESFFKNQVSLFDSAVKYPYTDAQFREARHALHQA